MFALNHVPPLHSETSTTGCCPRFNPNEWDGQTLEFRDKPFVKASTRSLFHIPLNMSTVITKTWERIKAAGADDAQEFIMLSIDRSPWKADHYFSVTKAVPDLENTTLSGQYLVKVFEGPFQDAANWHQQIMQHATQSGHTPKAIYFYYTTCPKCAKTYGKNYVVGLAQIS